MTQSKIFRRYASGAVDSGSAESKSGSAGVLPFVFATCAVARDGHDFANGCWVRNWKTPGRNGLTPYKRNPVICDGHDQSKRSLGKGIGLTETRDGDLIGAIEFADTPDGREAFCLYRDGYQNAVSVSWESKESKPARDRGHGALTFIRAELYEISLVTVPADENALVQGRAFARRASHLNSTIAQAQRGDLAGAARAVGVKLAVSDVEPSVAITAIREAAAMLDTAATSVGDRSVFIALAKQTYDGLRK